jgi:pimeloyl-ACP methyl ester carboxylesterase
MVFSPIHYRENELDDEFEIVSIKTKDGVTLEGVVYEHRKLQTIEPTLLFFPGSSHDAVGLIRKLSSSYPLVRIVSFNYRSYGKSDGVINEKNILNDGLEIASFTNNKYGEFYILGYSIGSVVASYVASRVKVKGVFLVGSFDSFHDLIKEKYKAIGKIIKVDISKIFRFKFNNKEHVKNIDAKTYIFSSKSDEITYIKNIRNLKQHVNNLVLYEEFDNLTHKEILWNPKVVSTISGVLK